MVSHDFSITGTFTVMSWENLPYIVFFNQAGAVDVARNLLPDDYGFKELVPLFL